MNWLQKIAYKIPTILWGLASEAQKYDTFDDFQRAFIGQIKHGMYWHITDDPKFFINPEKGPTDASSMGLGSTDKGKLMITSHLMYWASNYFPNRLYAALIDMSDVNPADYKQVNRGFGNEFFVYDTSNVKVTKVFHLKDALRIDDLHQESLPQSQEELESFYIAAKQQKATAPDDAIFEPTEEDRQVYEKRWQEDWISELEGEE